MTRVPVFPAVLLEVYKCIGEASRVKKWQKKFQTGVDLDYISQGEKSARLLHHIMEELDLDGVAKSDLLGNIIDEWVPFNKQLELNTWTHDASMRQVLWYLMCYSYAPILGRRLALWQSDSVGDPGMPTREFWYLPQVSADKQQLRLPVERVLDWWLDLMGGIDQVKKSIEQNAIHEDRPEAVERNINKWRGGATPNLKKINEYFSDNVAFEYAGTLDLSIVASEPITIEHYQAVVAYIERRKLTPDVLGIQIRVSCAQITEILASSVENAVDLTPLHEGFAREMIQRYSAPANSVLRQRVKVARMVQDGYLKLLAFLCPDVDKKSAAPRENKLLQAIDVYISAYQLTVESTIEVEEPFRRSLGNQKLTQEEYFQKLRSLEATYFDERVPLFMQCSCLTAISPRFNEHAAETIGATISKELKSLKSDKDLPDIWMPQDPNWPESIKAKAKAIFENEETLFLVKKALQHRTLSQILPEISDHLVLAKAMQIHELSNQEYAAILSRVEKLSLDDDQNIPILCARLRRALLLPNQKKWNLKTKTFVTGLIEEFEKNPHRHRSETYFLHYKARHLLAFNEFDLALEYFEKARERSLDRNHGRLTAEIALNAFACLVGMNKYIPNNHQMYYRFVMEYPVAEFISGEKNDVVDEVREYFWNVLYRPYPGLKKRIDEKAKLAQLQNSV